MMNTLDEACVFDNNVVVRLRISWKIFFGILGVICIYDLFFKENFGKNMQPDYDLYFLTIFFIFSQFFCFFFTEEGFHRGLKFGHRIIYSQKHFFEPWCYEKIQINGILPFYRMYVYKKNPLGLPFFLYANFLNLIIFIDENVSCDKMNPDARENFRRLADKYRKLKKNHKILYWILNNV